MLMASSRIFKAYHGKYCQEEKQKTAIEICLRNLSLHCFFWKCDTQLLLDVGADHRFASLGADMKFHLSHISGKANNRTKRTLSI